MMTIPKDDYEYMNAYTKAVEVIKKHNFEADNAVEYVETLAALEAIKVGLDEMAKSIQYSEARPNGEWIFTTEGNTDHITCSVCERDSMGTFDYCPNCGAKMAKGEEKDDK